MTERGADVILRERKLLLPVLAVLILVLVPVGVYASAAAAEASKAPVKAGGADYTVNSFAEYCDVLNSVIMRLEDTVEIRINNFSKEIYDAEDLAARLESFYPDTYYIDNIDYSWKAEKGGAAIMTVKLAYTYPKEKLVTMKKEIEAKINEILGKVTYPEMTPIDRELAIHDYICRTVKYYKHEGPDAEYPKDVYNPYGALFKGSANSFGYAKTMQVLLDRAGIKCITVIGDASTWNMVELDGEYYHLDACGDSYVTEDGSIAVVHDYFNISDEEMEKIGEWNRYIYPECRSMKANYFHMNGTFVDSFEGYMKVLREGIDNIRDIISVKAADYNEDSYNLAAALIRISDDYPDLDYVDYKKTNYYTNRELGIVNVIMVYDHPKAQLVSMKNEVTIKVDKIVKSVIKPEMTEYEKEKAIHDYLVFNAKYNSEGAEKRDVPFEEHDAYGVLIKGTGVCDSYAEAFKMLMDKVGIECMTVSGDLKGDSDDNVGHAWNIVRIDGKYYHVDVTFDDREYDDGLNDLCYDYFNLTDEDMAKDHIWDNMAYPKCTSTDANYFYKEDRVVKKSQVEGIMRNCLKNKEVVVHLKISDFSESFNIKGILTKLINTPSYKAKGVYWTTNGKQGVIKVTFEYY